MARARRPKAKTGFKEVRFVAASLIAATDSPLASPQGSGVVGVTQNALVNELLEQGWEIIEVITHNSAKKDCTAVALMMGKR